MLGSRTRAERRPQAGPLRHDAADPQAAPPAGPGRDQPGCDVKRASSAFERQKALLGCCCGSLVPRRRDRRGRAGGRADRNGLGWPRSARASCWSCESSTSPPWRRSPARRESAALRQASAGHAARRDPGRGGAALPRHAARAERRPSRLPPPAVVHRSSAPGGSRVPAASWRSSEGDCRPGGCARGSRADRRKRHDLRHQLGMQAPEGQHP